MILQNVTLSVGVHIVPKNVFVCRNVTPIVLFLVHMTHVFLQLDAAGARALDSTVQFPVQIRLIAHVLRDHKLLLKVPHVQFLPFALLGLCAQFGIPTGAPNKMTR